MFVGGGPRTVGILERIAASAPELLGPPGLEIHVVDPFPAGGGRIWRTTQSPLLWMNSTTADVTIFTDESVTCDGPIVPGPSLAEWVAGPGRDILEAAGLGGPAAQTGPADFASRQIQSHYLRWACAKAVSGLPRHVRVSEHRTHAVDVSEHKGGNWSGWRTGSELPADVVILAQGFLDRELTAEESALTAAAKDHGLTYLPPGYTADIDLSDLTAGEPVLVRGFGLAFVDVMVLLGEGRGGSFTDNDDGTLTYHPSGREPILHVGSRRGVPYHAKISYAVPGRVPVRRGISPRRRSPPSAMAAAPLISAGTSGR